MHAGPLHAYILHCWQRELLCQSLDADVLQESRLSACAAR
jgi:hypothetical protein